MFKPLYERKNAMKTPFFPLENPGKIIQGKVDFLPFLLLGKTRFQDSFVPSNRIVRTGKSFICHLNRQLYFPEN
jgi:hypothetical protein